MNETRRRDAVAAALEIMKMAPIKNTERNINWRIRRRNQTRVLGRKL